MAALKPRIVVAGHKTMKNDEWRPRDRANPPIHFGFRGSRRRTATAIELYDGMLSRYPEWSTEELSGVQQLQ